MNKLLRGLENIMKGLKLDENKLEGKPIMKEETHQLQEELIQKEESEEIRINAEECNLNISKLLDNLFKSPSPDYYKMYVAIASLDKKLLYDHSNGLRLLAL